MNKLIVTRIIENLKWLSVTIGNETGVFFKLTFFYLPQIVIDQTT